VAAKATSCPKKSNTHHFQEAFYQLLTMKNEICNVSRPILHQRRMGTQSRKPPAQLTAGHQADGAWLAAAQQPNQESG